MLQLVTVIVDRKWGLIVNTILGGSMVEKDMGCMGHHIYTFLPFY